jgi:cytoskeletal protein CcmA (bactofilin family)
VRSTTGPAIRIQGSIEAGEDICIEGIFNGELDAPEHRVTIGPKARVDATIRARELVVEGHLAGGRQTASKVIVRRGAIVASSLYAGAVQVDDGAEVRGRIFMGSPEAKAATR